MRTQEHEKLQEFFDLDDLASGMRHLRDASKVVARSIAGIMSSLVLPFRVLFSLDKTEALKKIEKYYENAEARDREIESELRSLGAYTFNPDMLLINPILGLASMPVQSTRFFFDEAGVTEIPVWLKKAQDRMAQEQSGTRQQVKRQGDLLDRLAHLFYEVRDPIGELIAEAASASKGEKEALDAFADAGIDLRGMQQTYFDEMVESLTDLRDTVKRRQEIFDKISKARTVKDLRDLLSIAKGIAPGFDSSEIESALDDFEAGETDDPNEINQVMGGIIGEGMGEMKAEIEKIIKKFPSLDSLQDSSHPVATDAIELIEEISGFIEQM